MEVIVMKPLKTKVSVTLDSDIVAQIKELSEKDERSFSQYVNLLLRNHLEQINKQSPKR